FNTAPSDVLRTVQRVIYAVNQWTALAAVLGFTRQWAPGDSPARRYLTAAVFPFYILHQTVIVVLAHGLKPLALAPAVEGPLLVAAVGELEGTLPHPRQARVDRMRLVAGIDHRMRMAAAHHLALHEQRMLEARCARRGVVVGVVAVHEQVAARLQLAVHAARG